MLDKIPEVKKSFDQLDSEVRKPFEELAKKWKSAIVSRDQIGAFTGGAISQGRMGNLDSLGEGPKGRIRVGRKVCYPVRSLIEWLIQRSVSLD